jgi:hypothetical protein
MQALEAAGFRVVPTYPARRRPDHE